MSDKNFEDQNPYVDENESIKEPLLEEEVIIEDEKQNEEYSEIEEHLNQLKKEKAQFSVNIDNKIKHMPDYHTNTIARPQRRISGFVKIMFAVIIIGISVLLSLAILIAAQDIFGFNKSDSVLIVDIPENLGVVGIADMLEERGVINSALLFKAYYKLSGFEGKLNYGAFELNTNMSYELILEELNKYSAAKNEVTVTFPEGLTLYEMSLKLEESKVCNAKEFLKVIDSTDFGFDFEAVLTDQPLRFHKLEGYVFPETYNFYTSDNPVNVAKKMLNVFDTRVTTEMRDKMKAMGYTIEQAITIASIVQKEAGKTSEMRKVASVYFNRLNNKDIYPNLQACPTRDYANQLKKQMDIIDQKVLDAYNTYEDAGLPPGAICNPGIDAINATLDPEETDYFYFCSNLKTKEFYYAKTLKEHERNIVKAGLS